MAIIVCPHCGKNTLTKFRRCIHCGEPLPKKEDKKDKGGKK
jgi:DNA-directed RNA polymerase subunit RPC12/RpoP